MEPPIKRSKRDSTEKINWVYFFAESSGNNIYQETLFQKGKIISVYFVIGTRPGKYTPSPSGMAPGRLSSGDGNPLCTYLDSYSKMSHDYDITYQPWQFGVAQVSEPELAQAYYII